MKRFSILKIGIRPVGTLILAIVFAVVELKFASLSNILNITFQASVLAILSFGQFSPVLAGGIDFSVSGQRWPLLA